MYLSGYHWGVHVEHFGWYGLKLFTKVISRRQKSPQAGTNLCKDLINITLTRMDRTIAKHRK